jgi:hypothetical protein
MWLRVFGSLAAPLFIAVSGMVVALTGRRKNHRLTHYVWRGGVIMLIGAGMDIVVFQQYPFVQVRVLYLIGLALPLAALVSRLAAAWQIAVGVVVLAASELLRAALGYPQVLRFRSRRRRGKSRAAFRKSCVNGGVGLVSGVPLAVLRLSRGACFSVATSWFLGLSAAARSRRDLPASA